jgi:hypothetical protein
MGRTTEARQWSPSGASGLHGPPAGALLGCTSRNTRSTPRVPPHLPPRRSAPFQDDLEGPPAVRGQGRSKTTLMAGSGSSPVPPDGVAAASRRPTPKHRQPPDPRPSTASHGGAETRAHRPPLAVTQLAGGGQDRQQGRTASDDRGEAASPSAGRARHRPPQSKLPRGAHVTDDAGADQGADGPRIDGHRRALENGLPPPAFTRDERRTGRRLGETGAGPGVWRGAGRAVHGTYAPSLSRRDAGTARDGRKKEGLYIFFSPVSLAQGSVPTGANDPLDES